LHSTARRNRLAGLWGTVHLCRKSYGFRTTVLNGENRLQRREHIRYVVHALVDIMRWDKGILPSGQGFTRDINSNGMFIYSDSEPRAQGHIEVEVSFPSLGEAYANLRMRTQSLIIRLEPPPSPEEQHGFASLTRSCKLHEGTTPLKRGT